MKIFYCKCGNKVNIKGTEMKECDCGKLFGKTGSISDHINMRKTWSGTTKVEFSTTTMDESIRKISNG
tara:strand:+ start:3006 stop:3209 length:204 start_codon:yes stop_codon:yes gene_type:complete